MGGTASPTMWSRSDYTVTVQLIYDWNYALSCGGPSTERAKSHSITHRFICSCQHMLHVPVLIFKTRTGLYHHKRRGSYNCDICTVKTIFGLVSPQFGVVLESIHYLIQFGVVLESIHYLRGR